MSTAPLNRRTLLALSAPAALVAFAACSGGNTSEKASENTASAERDQATPTQKIQLEETKLRDSNGYHLNKLTEGAPTVTLFTDYQCPYCAKAEPTYEAAAKELEGTMNVTVRHLPLLKIHANAGPSASAVQAAQNQGKHLAMAHKLFENQSSWEKIQGDDKIFDKMAEYAKEIGLDADKFKKDYHDEETGKIIQEDMKQAQSLGVKGTPQFVVNDKKVEGVDSKTSKDEMIKTFKEAAGL